MLPQLHYFFLDMLMKVFLGEGERGVFLDLWFYVYVL